MLDRLRRPIGGLNLHKRRRHPFWRYVIVWEILNRVIALPEIVGGLCWWRRAPRASGGAGSTVRAGALSVRGRLRDAGGQRGDRGDPGGAAARADRRQEVGDRGSRQAGGDHRRKRVELGAVGRGELLSAQATAASERAVLPALELQLAKTQTSWRCTWARRRASA